MNMNKFAYLVSWLTHITEQELDSYNVEKLNDLVQGLIEPVPVQEQPKTDVGELDHLLGLMQEGTRKIEAIKSYRMLTGAGLKESKDAVEKYWVSKTAPLTSD